LDCYIFSAKGLEVTRAPLALFKRSLFCLLALVAQIATAQTAARPAPVSTPSATNASVTTAPVDNTVPDDPAVDQMLTAYSPKVRALDEVIGKLKGDLRKGGVGAGSLGNFVTDGIRARAAVKLGTPVMLAVTNNGGLRKNAISEGELKLRDVFELLPFENALVAFDLSGAQVMELLRVMMSHADAQSGARVTYRVNPEKRPEFESAKFIVNGAEKAIDPAGMYTVICIDYLLNVTGGDYAAVLKQAKNIRPLGLTIRDAITEYVKAESAAGREIKSTLDGRYVFDRAASGGAEEPKQ
jgi:2',3'-cyclic-nucleotide 2'-phosphodiesterase (5'-nucleotidase family)